MQIFNLFLAKRQVKLKNTTYNSRQKWILDLHVSDLTQFSFPLRLQISINILGHLIAVADSIAICNFQKAKTS